MALRLSAEGCALLNSDTPKLREEYLGRIPAERADVHNAYFDAVGSGVDLIMGPTQICEDITWTDDIEGGFIPGKGCDKGRFPGGCMYNCLSRGVTGDFDKAFTKAKFVVPAGSSPVPASPFRSTSCRVPGRASRRSLRLVGVRHHRAGELEPGGALHGQAHRGYTLASAGFGRAEAPLNAISGLSGLGEGSGEVPG